MISMIYPFSSSLYPIICALNEKEQTNRIHYAVSPPSWGVQVENVNSEIIYSTDFIAALESVASVIVADFIYNDYLYRDVIEKISLTLEKGKQIICYSSLKEPDRTRFSTDYPSLFSVIDNNSIESVNDVLKLNFRYRSQDCIIIGVGNMMKGLDDIAITVIISELLKKQGYRVKTISTNHNCGLLRYNDYPMDIYSSTVSEEDKVLALNAYIHNIEEKSSPDIIVVQFPSGMMEYTDMCHGGFCVKSFMLSQAISVDYFILNAPSMEPEAFSPERFSELSKIFEYKYGFAIDHICIEDKIVDDFSSMEEEDIVYQYIDKSDLQKLVSMINDKKCSSCYDESSYNLIVQDCINKLSTLDEEF